VRICLSVRDDALSTTHSWTRREFRTVRICLSVRDDALSATHSWTRRGFSCDTRVKVDITFGSSR